MAAKLQLSAPEVLDISGETEATRSSTALDQKVTEDFGRNCLIARRMLERGVRFVQVWSGADNGFPRRNWDSHEDIAKDHAEMAAGMDQPAAALIKDLKSRGMLDDTIVFWTTEFGRMPCSQGSQGTRPQSVRLYRLVGRRRHQRRQSVTAPATSGRIRWRTNRPTATTSMPPCCACWVSTTRG